MPLEAQGRGPSWGRRLAGPGKGRRRRAGPEQNGRIDSACFAFYSARSRIRVEARRDERPRCFRGGNPHPTANRMSPLCIDDK